MLFLIPYRRLSWAVMWHMSVIDSMQVVCGISLSVYLRVSIALAEVMFLPKGAFKDGCVNWVWKQPYLLFISSYFFLIEPFTTYLRFLFCFLLFCFVLFCFVLFLSLVYLQNLAVKKKKIQPRGTKQNTIKLWKQRNRFIDECW